MTKKSRIEQRRLKDRLYRYLRSNGIRRSTFDRLYEDTARILGKSAAKSLRFYSLLDCEEGIYYISGVSLNTIWYA